MKRDFNKLAEKEFDLVIIGAGIFGACAAWDAVSRGLSVALIEKNDFSHATSANHFKIIHGGIRYIQHGDVIRVRESSRERSALIRIAPHLAKPIPIVIPTHNRLMEGKAVLKTGMFLFNLLTLDRNAGLQTALQIPSGGLLSRQEVLKHFPNLNQTGITGGAVFYDGQMYNPPRIAISFIRSAVQKGLVCANYVEATGLLKTNNKICGVIASDRIDGKTTEIRSRIVLNAAGPWANHFLQKHLNLHLNPEPTFSRDLALVINRKPESNLGIALLTQTEDADSVVDRGGRHLFFIPWRKRTLVGVWHKVFHQLPEDIDVKESEIETYVSEANQVYPHLNLSVADVSMINTGLTLFGSKEKQGKAKLSFGKRSLLIDHASQHNFEGLVTLIGVRATTARGMAETALKLIFRKLGKTMPSVPTHKIPIYGGDFGSFDEIFSHAQKKHRSHIDINIIKNLIHNYGSRYFDVLAFCSHDQKGLDKTLSNSQILKAEVVHAVHNEMAKRLADTVFRRTDLGTGGHPGKQALLECADLMADALNWDQKQKMSEIDHVNLLFQKMRNYN